MLAGRKFRRLPIRVDCSSFVLKEMEGWYKLARRRGLHAEPHDEMPAQWQGLVQRRLGGSTGSPSPGSCSDVSSPDPRSPEIPKGMSKAVIEERQSGLPEQLPWARDLKVIAGEVNVEQQLFPPVATEKLRAPLRVLRCMF